MSNYDAEDESSIEDEIGFDPGDPLMIYLDDGDLELGVFTQVSEFGIIFKKTHRRVEELNSEGEVIDWSFGLMQQPVRVFLPWHRIERLEMHEDVRNEHQLNKFSALMSEVTTVEDIETLASLEDDD